MKTGDWHKARVLLSQGPRILKVATNRAVRKEAQFLRGKIVQGIQKQAPGDKRFKSLAATTIAIRQAAGFRGTKALLRRGDLWKGIGVNETREGFFVGVLRAAVNAAGQRLVNIAEANEFGSKPIVIPVTDKMRKFVMMAFNKAGLSGGGNGGFRRGFIISQIPARPFLRPVFEKYGKTSADRVKASLAEYLKGTFS